MAQPPNRDKIFPMNRAFFLSAVLLSVGCSPSTISEKSLLVTSDLPTESASTHGFRLDSVATHSAALSWVKLDPAPQDLKVRASSASSPDIIETRVPVSSSMAVIDGLKAETEYRVDLVSFEPEIVVASVNTRTKEPKADNVRVSAVGSHTARLDWDDRSDVEKEYRIMSADVTDGSSSEVLSNVIGTVPANSISYTATGLEPGHQYEMWVVAIEDGEVARPSTRVVVKARAASSEAPAALDVEQLSSAFITLRWEDKSDNEDGFVLSVSGDQGATWCEQVDAVGPNITSSILEVHSQDESAPTADIQTPDVPSLESVDCSTIARLKSGNSYLFRVQSVKGQELSLPSNELAVTIP
jgi:hypothetical protein